MFADQSIVSDSSSTDRRSKELWILINDRKQKVLTLGVVGVVLGKSPQEKQTKAFSPLLLLFLVVVIRSHRFIHRKLTTNPQLYPPGETLGQEVL